MSEVRHPDNPYETSEFSEFLFECAYDPILLCDHQGVIVRVNAHAQSMLGYRKDELLGRKLDTLVPERFQQSFHEFADPRLAAEQEIYVQLKDGRELPVDIMLSPLETSKGQLIISVLHDLSERDRQLEASQMKLLMQQREDFVATLTHDLKTPVLAANRAIKLLVAGDFGSVSESQVQVLRAIIESNDAMYALLRTLLDVYRYDSGAKQLHLGTHSLSETVDHLLAELMPIAQFQNITLQSLLPPEPLPIVCDEEEIRRVFQNLLDNALKFTPSGGSISVYAEQSNGLTTVSVRDTGKGIKADEKLQLFQRFWQAPHSGRHYASTGLGLYLCRKIVELHGGNIWCESKPGCGSTFKFTLRAPIAIAGVA